MSFMATVQGEYYLTTGRPTFEVAVSCEDGTPIAAP
jgi:hypothetical protein